MQRAAGVLFRLQRRKSLRGGSLSRAQRTRRLRLAAAHWCLKLWRRWQWMPTFRRQQLRCVIVDRQRSHARRLRSVGAAWMLCSCQVLGSALLQLVCHLCVDLIQQRCSSTSGSTATRCVDMHGGSISSRIRQRPLLWHSAALSLL